MENYEQMLDKAYKEVKVVGQGGERFEIPKVQGQVSGNSTIITNIGQIAGYIRRPLDHLTKFLQKELAVPGKIDNGRLIFTGRLNSARVNEKLEKYIQEFVLCPVCGKPDTEIIQEKGIRTKKCLACGAQSPIKYHL